MSPLDYLHIQLRLEGKEIVHGNLLRQVEVVPGEEMPLMIVGFLSSGEPVAYYDESLPVSLRETLEKETSTIGFPNVNPIIQFLQSRAVAVEVGHYKTYRFPEQYKQAMFEAVNVYSKSDFKIQTFGFAGFAEQVYAIERHEEIIAACVSARENQECAEAWVYTDPDFRHRGFAKQIVSVWAGEILQTGKIPFYSHKIQNTASANLARRLELQPVFEEVSISYKNV